MAKGGVSDSVTVTQSITEWIFFPLPFLLFLQPVFLMSQLTVFPSLDVAITSLSLLTATIPPPSAMVDTTWEILLADPMILIPISCTLIVAAGILLIVLFLAHRNCTSEILFTHTNGANGGCSNRSPSHHTSVGTFSQQALHLLSQHQTGQLGFHETQCELLFFFTFSLSSSPPPPSLWLNSWDWNLTSWLPDWFSFYSCALSLSLSLFCFFFLSHSFTFSPSTLVFLLYCKVQIPFPNNTPPKLDEFHVCVCAVVSFNFISPFTSREKSQVILSVSCSVVFFPPSLNQALLFFSLPHQLILPSHRSNK